MTVVRNLVSGIVDYAGLFPPASLSMEQAVGNFARYLDSEYEWMLARLILPVDRLDEFEQINSFATSDRNWRISSLVPSVGGPNFEFKQSMESIVQFNRRHAGNKRKETVIDAVEIKVPSVGDTAETIGGTPDGLNLFMEVPYAADPTEFLQIIRDSGDRVFAKIRTGGVTADLIPSAFELARFISICAELNIGFKATAGLHHPLRGAYPLTYDRNPPIGMMFGFVNVFVAACLAFSKSVPIETLESILIESESNAFVVSDSIMKWRDFELSDSDVLETRTRKAISFGSCSFEEPTAELEQLGWLAGVESARDTY